eukprot:1865200-Pleurochrysis_carterae.AAC.1
MQHARRKLPTDYSYCLEKIQPRSCKVQQNGFSIVASTPSELQQFPDSPKLCIYNIETALWHLYCFTSRCHTKGNLGLLQLAVAGPDEFTTCSKNPSTSWLVFSVAVGVTGALAHHGDVEHLRFNVTSDGMPSLF